MEFKEKLQNVFNKYNIKYNQQQIDQLCEYKNLLIETNKKYNLTSILDDDGIIYKHFLDSVVTYNYYKQKAKIIDIGVGGGFPSIPLKIMRPDLSFTLVDSVNKKIEFLKLVCDKLQLEKVELLHSRCEDLAYNNNYRQCYDYAVARAVAELNILLEYLSPFVKVNNQLVIYKGSNYNTEIDNAKNALLKLNCKITNKDLYDIAEIDSQRCILYIEKYKTTGTQYPRKNNKPRTNPL